MILREVKTNPYRVVSVFVNDKCNFGIKSSSGISFVKSTELSICDRYQTGSSVCRDQVLDVFMVNGLKKRDDEKISVSKNDESEVLDVLDDINSKKKSDINEYGHQMSLLEIDDELKRIDDIIN